VVDGTTSLEKQNVTIVRTHGSSGVIMFKETLYQSTKDGRSFVSCLKDQGVSPGIKV
jgi:fructose-bisphosphate aldolase class 1